MEREIRAARLSQLSDLANDKDNGDDDDYNDDDLGYHSDSGNQQQQEDGEHLHIKLRGKDNKDIGLRVKPVSVRQVVHEPNSSFYL